MTETSAVRVVLADDEPLIRSGLRALIESEPDLCVVGEADDGAEVVPLVRRLRPDVVLMDVRMPKVDGLQATAALLRLADPPRVIVLTTFDNDDYVYGALHAGASGFLLKRSRPEQIMHGIRLAASGDSLLFPSALRSLVAANKPRNTGGLLEAHLTDRESEVLTLMARGLSNSEIAGEMFLGVETVKTHVGSVLSKVGARDRTQAVIFAYESGFL